VNAIINNDSPNSTIQARVRGMPYHLLIVTWCWIAVVTTLIAISETAVISQAHIFLALYCFIIILLRPFREAPLALMLLAIGPNDNLIFFGALLFFLRSILSGKLYIKNNVSGYLFLFFLSLVLCSTMISYLTVEFRPLQTIFWSVTFLIPITLCVAHFKYMFDGLAVAKYGTMLISMQILPVIAAIPSYIKVGSPDVFGGTWLDADIVGFWGTALAVAAFLLFFLGKNIKQGKTKVMSMMAVGAVLSILASGKIYSVFIIFLGLFFFIKYFRLIQGLLNAKVKSFVFLLVGSIGAIIVITTLFTQAGGIQNWLKYQHEHSHKTIFLDRVFNQMATYNYSNLFGVGPGMLGSRSANAVSANILHKEEMALPKSVQGAPQPEAEILRGLYDKEFQDKIRYMSANLVIPFSGIGAMKGEMGWLGLISVVLLFLLLFWPLRVYYHLESVNYQVTIVYFMATISGLSIVLLSIFDTAWEQPKIMVFLAMLVLAIQRSNKLMPCITNEK